MFKLLTPEERAAADKRLQDPAYAASVDQALKLLFPPDGVVPSSKVAVPPSAKTVVVNINPPDLPSIDKIPFGRRREIISIIQKELEEINKIEKSSLNVIALAEICLNDSERDFRSYVVQQARKLHLQNHVAMTDIVITPLLEAPQKILSDADMKLSAAKWHLPTPELESFANAGDLQAQYWFGLRCALHPINSQELRVKWWRKAAEQGEPQSQWWLGGAYEHGSDCLQQNLTEALRLYRLAAEQGHELAMIHLGKMYASGLGVEKDSREALKWLGLAVAKGNERAQKIQSEILAEVKKQNLKSPKPEKKQGLRLYLIEFLPDWAKWFIPFSFACIVFSFIQPDKPHYLALYSPPQPVNVSPYTRADGTPVSGYNRTLPGERENANEINAPRISSNTQMEQNYNSQMFIALGAALFTLWLMRTALTLK